MRSFLGIDTSNYRTSAACYLPESGEYTNANALLAVPDGAIGLRQADAVFQHTRALHQQIARLPQGSFHAIGVSTRPRETEGSYMPCFLVGESVARSAAHLLSIPVFENSHQQGHLAAAAFSADRLDLLHQNFLCWHVSGGTTELLLAQPTQCGVPHCHRIGGTSDLAAGQLVDRIGARFGFAFPSGAALDTLALQAVPQKGFAVKVQDGQFSLSGMQNKAEQLLAAGEPNEIVARFVLDTLARTLETASLAAQEAYPYPILFSGGVMASKVIRERLARLPNAIFATPELSGDNAVGCAILAAIQYERTTL